MRLAPRFKLAEPWASVQRLMLAAQQEWRSTESLGDFRYTKA